jgi:biopolymer transport protein ExbD
MIHAKQNKKNLNVELNLLPIFDVLSVCICFLLMTVVWVEIRQLETKQSFGGQSAAETKKESSLWMSIDENSNLSVIYRPASGSERKTTIPSKRGQIDFEVARAVMEKAFSQNYSVSHILPARTTKYDQVIKLMDISKQAGIKNIGLSPI